MKILYPSHVNMSEQREGNSIHLLEIALNLQKQGNDLLIICQGGKHISHLLPTKQIPSFRVRYLRSLFLDLVFIPYLLFYITKFKPDTVYYRDVSVGGIISWFLNVPSVAEANGIYPDIAKIENPRFYRIASPFLKLRERIQYFRATRIICVTEGTKNELVKNYGVKNEICRVIHNGVNTRLFKPSDKMVCRGKLGIKGEYFYIGFVGAFKAWQGLEILIDAMKIVKERGYDAIRSILVGDGNLMKRLKEMVKRSGLQKEIVFTGRIGYENVPAFINSFDICYLCKIGSKLGFFSPLKLYEYIACARPVIASRVEGISEIVEEGNCGYLFDPDDVSSLVSSIIESYNARDKLPELGKNGRRFIEDKFSWQQVADRVQSVLKEAVGQR